MSGVSSATFAAHPSKLSATLGLIRGGLLGIGVADPRTMGPVIGYNLFFILGVDPARQMAFDLSAALNSSLAFFAGLLFSWCVFLPWC